MKGLQLYSAILLAVLVAAAAAAPPAKNEAVLTEIENRVYASPPPRYPWERARKGRFLMINELLAARDLSWGLVKLSLDRSLHVKSNSEVRILKSLVENGHLGLAVQKGEVYLHSRENYLGSLISTSTARIKPKGTQFVVKVDEDGTTTITMIEGAAEVENVDVPGAVELRPNEQAVVRAGQRPVVTAVIDAMNTVQWCLYYPAVIHLPEIGLTERERRDLAKSIEAYGSGDLVRALNAWPAGYVPRSAATRVFRAMVVLVVGEVDRARTALEGVPKDHAGRRAVEDLIEAVTYRPEPELKVNLTELAGEVDGGGRPRTAGEWLARSYLEQARGNLEAARAAARRSGELGPEFGFAAVRVAELEFSFGRSKEASQALEDGMRSTPRNAQGWALRGFLLSGRNRIREALQAFDHAIEIDGALGNAWLGRGLCKFRLGEREDGRADLQVAVALEPNRSLLHSYLGKASTQLGFAEAGMKDLAFAKELDPNDPTPWLYSALARQEQNRPNQAIDDLHAAIARNDNRRLYRSRFLLDQDRAVRSVNLAQLYQYNGMDQVAVREATRAVESNYTNASAHLFLANAFDALRDPTRVELRYETPWFNELLLANLLSPVGGGRLSQFVSQHEYSKLLESDGLGGAVINEWRSDSEWRSTASAFGTYGRTSFGVDVHYRDDAGDRSGADDRRLEVYGQLKHEVTPNDIVYFLGKYQDQESGDTFKTFDHQPLAPGLQFEERQEPGLLLAGWNHRWGPGSHTLVLGGRLSAEQDMRDPRAEQLLLKRGSSGLPPGLGSLQNANPPGISVGPPLDFVLTYSPDLLEMIDPFIGSGSVTDLRSAAFEFATRREWEIYSAEIQHIQELRNHTLLAGARFQSGEFETETDLELIRPNLQSGFFPSPAAKQRVSHDFERLTAYAYDYWQPAPWLTLLGGLSWDRIDYPANFRNPPVSDEERRDEQLSGKFGFTLSPSPWFTVRGMYSEGLGGVSFDESVRLEPVQLAGFNQAYRTVLSESLGGSVEAPQFSIWGLSVEGMLPTRTWWGAAVNSIEQDVDRTIGAFMGYGLPQWPADPAFFPGGTAQTLDYDELSLQFTVNQLIGDKFAVGALYRMTRSELRSALPEVPVAVAPSVDQTNEATLHEVSLFGNWNSPTGLFARAEANWYKQDLEDDLNRIGGVRDGDEFWQLNAFLGYRFMQNQGEVSVGVLNINDADYNLSPLNPYGNLARERTAVLRCRFSF